MTPSKTPLRSILAWGVLLAVALGLRIGLAIYSPNVFHPDEIFQSLEPAHRLAYGYGMVSWEWRQGIRSWVFPAFLAVVMRATGWMASGSTGYLDGIIVVLSLISLSTVWFGYAWAKRASGTPAAIIAAGACSVSFWLVYFAPKALNEVIATHLLLPGLYLGVYAEKIGERKRLFFAGVLCGLAASLRIQLIPAILFAAIYFCYPHWRRRIPIVFFGLSLPVLAFGLVDWLTWSYPWQSFIRNFQVNAIQDRSSWYGVHPWYWYFKVLLILVGPAVFFLWHGARRSPFLAYFSLVALGSHLLIAHKEIRYLYPILPLALTLASIGFVELIRSFRPLTSFAAAPRSIPAAGLIFFAVSSVLIAIPCFRFCRTTYAVVAFNRLSRDSSVCGIALYQVPWCSGGYAHLHRNIPIVPISDAAEFQKQLPTFNALVAPPSISNLPPAFKKTACWNGNCLFQRAGTCVAPAMDKQINRYLIETGQ